MKNNPEIFFRIDFRQVYAQDLHLHLEELPMLYNQIKVKMVITTLKTFRSHQQLWCQFLYHWIDKRYNSKKHSFSFVFSFQKRKWFKFTLRIENRFLLDSGASISVLYTFTFTMIAQMFIVCSEDQHATSKIYTIANQSRAPFEQYLYLSCWNKIKIFQNSFRCSS